MRAFLLILGLVVIGALALANAGRWELLRWKIARKFPGVPSVGTSQLAGELTPSKSAPLLLDVRTRAEFEVSHLPGARQIDPDSAAAGLALPKDTAIVTYCSVGYRSAAFAARLQKAGFSQVRNLQGSIFQWANEGRPLVDSLNRPAFQVHPYNASWGRLLNAERRAAVAPAE